MIATSVSFQSSRSTGLWRQGAAQRGFGKKAPAKKAAEPLPQLKAEVPASADPKKGWRSLGERGQLFETKAVKGVDTVGGKAVAVYLHKDKIYCRCGGARGV